MHRAVVERGEILLEALAVGAVRVGKDSDLAPAVAAHDGDGVVEGQRCPLDRPELALALLGEIAPGLGVDRPSREDHARRGVDVHDVHALRVAHHHFVEVTERRSLHAFHIRVAELVVQHAPNRRFVRGRGGCNQKQEQSE